MIPETPREEDPAERDPAVGGRVPEGEDGPERPLEEAGQGVSEGAEQTEEELAESATHGEGGGDPGDVSG